jgi:hypothetical protein
LIRLSYIRNLPFQHQHIFGHFDCTAHNTVQAASGAAMAGKSSAKKSDNPADKATALSQPAHCLPAAEVLTQLGSNPQTGLRDDEVSKNQGIYGSNALEGSGGSGPIRILMNQVLNALTMVSPLTPSRHVICDLGTDRISGLGFDHGYGCQFCHQVVD